MQQIQATGGGAFAAILADGSVVTWGMPRHGGDCSAVQDQLRNVQQIQATNEAFAAILADGSVVTWGAPNGGGDCSAVQDQLRNVQQIQATDGAFAGILTDGSVVCWGASDRGGDCSAVRDQLRNVQQIRATLWAFAAILADGSVVAWGDPTVVVTVLQFKSSSNIFRHFDDIYSVVWLLHGEALGDSWETSVYIAAERGP